MATYHDISVDPAPFKADVDFSACVTTIYRLVTVASTAGNVKLANGASNPAALGVIQNSPSLGGEAAVRVIGFSKLAGRSATCNLRPGTFLVAASDGFAEAQTVAPGSPVFGRWMGPTLTGAGTSGIGEALLFGYTACAVSAS